MPTQQEVEFVRRKHQQFSVFKLKYSVLISFCSNLITAPMEFIKIRSQMLQEGRVVHGWNIKRGVPAMRMVYEVVDSGAGLRGLWAGWDSLIARSLWQGSLRCFFWCNIWNYFNQDPRRSVSMGKALFSHFSTGFLAGVLTNPIDLVYNRQVADALYPDRYKRNYTSLFNGILKANAEGVLFRGSIASGLSYGLLLASMSNFYDYLKEFYYDIFGPTVWLRSACLVPVSILGTYAYLPFDNVKTRMHLMRELPDGTLPYKNAWDAFIKIAAYEANYEKFSNYHCYLAGATSFFLKLYLTLHIGVYISDIAFRHIGEEGELIDSSYTQTPYARIVPFEHYNRSHIHKIYTKKVPDKQFFIDEHKKSSFKV